MPQLPSDARRRRRRRAIVMAGVGAVAIVLWGPAASSHWSHDAKVSSVTLTAGTLGATLSDVPKELKVLASDTAHSGGFTVTNSGNVQAPYTVSFKLPRGAKPFAHTLSTWERVGTCAQETGANVKTGTWGDLSYSGVLAAGTQVPLCVKVATPGGQGAPAASFSGKINLHSTLSSWSARASAVTTVAQEARPYLLDIAAVSPGGVGVRVDSGDLAGEIVRYELWRSNKETAQGEVVAQGPNHASFLIDETFTANWATPPADQSYWYQLTGVRSDEVEIYATEPREVFYPFGTHWPSVIRWAEPDGQGQLCWEAASLTAGALMELQPCNGAEPRQQFVLLRDGSATSGRVAIYAQANTNLAVVRDLDNVARNDNITLGKPGGTETDVWQPQPVPSTGSPTANQKLMTVFRNNAVDSGDPKYACVTAPYNGAGAPLVVGSSLCAAPQEGAAWHVDSIE